MTNKHQSHDYGNDANRNDEKNPALIIVKPPGAGPTVIATMIARRRKGSTNLINLRRKNKITFRQPVDFVRPNLKVYLAVSQKNIRMMPLLLGDFSDAIGEFQRLAKIWKFEPLFQSLPFRQAPAAMQLMFELPERISFERRRFIVTGNALLFCKF
jgi:hypothetical protein